MKNKSMVDTQSGRSPDDFTNQTKPSENLVTHGLNQITKIAFSRSIKSVTHNFHSGQYAVLFADGKVEIYLKDGSQEKLKPNEEFEGIVYASKSKVYVAWDKEGVLKLFTHSFDHISDVTSQSNINIVKYNEFKNEIISTTHGKITIWKFTLNNSLVVPMFVIKDFLYPDLPVNVIAIEPTSSKMQRMFVAVKSEVIVFRLQDGQCISKLPDVHKRDITDLVFYQPLQILLTSAADGSIKLWDEAYNVRSVFVGHTDSVNCLSVSQQGPFALSGSTDGSLRLYNIDSNEEVQCMEIGKAVAGICRKMGENDFFTYTKKSISFWTINNVYSVFTIIGSKAKMLKTTTHSTVPSLSYYVCEDACIRIACPKTGNIVCVMMSPDWKRIKDAICVPTEGKLFVLLRDGVILNCSIEQNPCKIDETWTPEHSGEKSICTTLCLFECFEERTAEGDWRDSVTPNESQNSRHEVGSSAKMQNKPFKTLLIGGCEDGKLVVYKWDEGSDSGKISFSIEGHRDRIVALASNNELKQLASCSTDNAVRIWRIYPFTEGTLFPLMFILNSEPATHLVYSRTHLCVALQDASTATYNITMFKIADAEPERLEHSTDDDHQDSIIALCNCPKLNIFASASVDGTIKIWNENNSILGVVKLHSKPSGMCFSTEKGDLLIAIGEHVYKIPYEKYLPEKMVQHMAVLPFNRLQDISPIMVDKDVLAAMDIDQKHRLQKARSSELFLAKFVDIIPLDELEDRKLKKAQKDLAVSVLKKRDHDLEQIRNGKLTVKKRAVSPSVREEAWKKYLDLFYTRKPIPPIGKKDDSDDDDDDDDNNNDDYRPKERCDKFFPERGNTGFFSISTDVSNIKKLTAGLKEKEREKIEDKKMEPESALLPKSEHDFPLRETTRPLSGGLKADIYHSPPYSLLRRILSAPPKVRVPELTINRKSMVKYLKPIDIPPASDFPLNTTTLRNISRETAADADNKNGLFNENREAMGMLPIAPDGYLPNSIIVALYKELKKTSPVEEKEEDWKPKALTQEQLEELEENEKRKKRKSFNQLEDPERRRRNIFKRFSMFSMSSRAESEINIDTPPPTPPPSSPHTEEEPPAKPKEIKPLMPIEKLISKPIIVKPPTPPPREPTPPPPRPQTPLPRFITQFKGQEWFEKFFPDVEPEMFPRPWTVESFLQILLDLVRKPFDFDTRTHILAAILILHRQGLFSEEADTVVQYSLLALLKEPLSCPSDELESKNQFLKLCLTLLASLEMFDEHFIIELMAQYITSDIDLRQHVIQILRHEVGLQDPHDYFLKELDTFTTYGIFDNFKKKQAIYQQCRDWIDSWKQLFKKHIISLRGKIYRAKKGNVVRGTKSTKANLKGILKKEQEGVSPQSSDRKISFMPNDFIDDAAEGVGPVDTINYFCEVEYEKELERAREASVAPPKEVIQTEKLRDSVILLPKIHNYRSLARLGETHQSCCHPERETILAYDMRLPSFRQSKNDNLHRGLLLHLQPITLNPFPNLLDELLYEPHANSQLITLRSAPKYFVPARSYVQNLQI